MFRRLLLYLSERRGLQRFILRRELARRVAYRFVAGENLDMAIEATRELNGRGMKVTLDRLGESVDSREQAERAAGEYIAALERIERQKLDAGISIKLTQIGLAIDNELCRANLRKIAEAAGRYGNFVRIDMESSAYVQGTLDLFYEAFAEYRDLGVVIQSYLRRSESDVRELASRGAPVRLCKGAYKEPEQIAFQSKDEVDANYVQLLEILMESGSPLAIATHDSEMIEAAKRLGKDRLADPGLEFQMLYGVRRDLQAQLVAEGYRMRIYVPYGTEWYPYFMRRMAERPANVIFVMRALMGR